MSLENKKEIQANLDLNGNSIEDFSTLKMSLESWVSGDENSANVKRNLIKFDSSENRICIYNLSEGRWVYFYDTDEIQNQINEINNLLEQITNEERYEFDDTPTDNSTNLVRSGDIYDFVKNEISGVEEEFPVGSRLSKTFGKLNIGESLDGMTAVEAIKEAFCSPVSFTVNSLTASPNKAYLGETKNITLTLNVTSGSYDLTAVSLENESLNVNSGQFTSFNFTKTVNNVSATRIFNTYSVSDGVNTDTGNSNKQAKVSFYYKVLIGKNQENAIPNSNTSIISNGTALGMDQTSKYRTALSDEFVWIAIPNGSGLSISKLTENGFEYTVTSTNRVGDYDLYILQEESADTQGVIQEYVITFNKSLEVI